MIQCRLVTNALYDLKAREVLSDTVHIDEAIPHILLSTCNRTEVYWGEGRASENVIRHLYRVAAGLESALVGERAIQGQLKQAYATALKKYALPPALHRLFQSALHTGKRVRTETKIAEGAVSHSQVVADILKFRKINLKEKVVCIIGINKLTEDILKYLASRGAVNIFLSNRNKEKARGIAGQYKATVMGLDHKRDLLEWADIVICATSAPHTLITPDDIRGEKELLIFDLAFPRDVDEKVGARRDVELFDLDDIERFARENRDLRYNETDKAERIIEEEIARFYQWQSYAGKQNTYE